MEREKEYIDPDWSSGISQRNRVKAVNLEYFFRTREVNIEYAYGFLKNKDVWCTKMEIIYLLLRTH